MVPWFLVSVCLELVSVASAVRAVDIEQLSLDGMQDSSAIRAVDTDELVLEQEEESTWSFSGDPAQICGGSEIWSMITGGGDVSDPAMNIQWSKIEAVKNAHIEDQKSTIELLEKQLTTLNEQLAKAEKDEETGKTTEGQNKQLIEDGVKPYGGSEVASKYKCGRVRKVDGQRAPKEVRSGYDTSIEGFPAVAKDFFEKNQVRLDGKGFLDKCNEMLTKGDDTMQSYCGRLCQQLKDRAASESFNAHGAVVSQSNKIKDKIQAVTEKLTKAKASESQCSVDWDSLKVFRTELSELTETYDDRHEKLRNAEEMLYDLDESVEDLSDKIKEEQEQLKEAVDKLSKAGDKTREATVKLDKAKAKEEELQGKIDGMEKDMLSLTEELTKASDAHKMVEKVKEHVTNTMMMMMQFIDTALREPLLDLGFTEDIDEVSEGFAPAGETDAAVVVKKAIGSLEQYCKETAIPSFHDLKEKTGLCLAPLCSFDPTDAVYDDLLNTVNKRMAEIKKQLLQVVNWLNPWKAQKGKSMEEGEKMEDELVKSGAQLAYLEQVKGFYAGPSEIFKYVIGWRKDGPHHKLVKKLGEAIQRLESKLEQLKKAAGETKAANEEAGKAREEAMKELEAAQKDEKLAADEKAAVEEAIAKLKEEWEKRRQEMEDWEDKVNKARAALEAAKKALDEAYEQGTSFLESAHLRQPRTKSLS